MRINYRAKKKNKKEEFNSTYLRKQILCTRHDISRNRKINLI